MGFVTATIGGLSGGIVSVGGYSDPVRATIRGTPTPVDPCTSPMGALNWTGLGVSIGVVTGSVEFPDCPPCEITPGDEVVITRGTLLFITFSDMTFKLQRCGTKSTGLSVDFFKTFGLEGSVSTFKV